MARNPWITPGQMAAHIQEWPLQSIYSLTVYFCLFLLLLALDLHSGSEPGKDNRRLLIDHSWMITGKVKQNRKLDIVDAGET